MKKLIGLVSLVSLLVVGVQAQSAVSSTNSLAFDVSATVNTLETFEVAFTATTATTNTLGPTVPTTGAVRSFLTAPAITVTPSGVTVVVPATSFIPIGQPAGNYLVWARAIGPTGLVSDWSASLAIVLPTAFQVKPAAPTGLRIQ